MTIIFPLGLALKLDEVSKKILGVPRNAFVCMAVAYMIVKVSPILDSRKRNQMLKKIQETFDEAMEEARKSA